MENDFENARNQTEEMFANENEQASEQQEQPVSENAVPDEGQALSAATAQTEDAIQTAEAATRAAEEQNAQLNQVMSELGAMKQQNDDLQQQLKEMSDVQKEKIVEQAIEMPTLNLDDLAFADDETKANVQREYAQKMAEYVKGDIMKEMSPFVEQAKEGLYQKEKNEVVAALSQIPELAGIEQMLPQMEQIIKNNDVLSSDSVPMDEKYIMAYAIARGVNSINTPPEEKKEPTAEELMELYDKNPTFQELVEKKRLEAVKDSQQVPPLTASNGAVNVALNIKEKPKTFEEASERTRKMFGLS